MLMQSKISDPQITKQDKDWLYPQMIQAIKNIRDYYSCIFSHQIDRVGKLSVKQLNLLYSKILNIIRHFKNDTKKLYGTIIRILS